MRIIHGTNGSESIAGAWTDSNQIWSLDGNDSVNGGMLNDELHGGKGADTLLGNGGNDTIYGDSGNDVLFGGAGNDTVYGGDGNDSISGGVGNDLMSGGQGNDTLNGNSGDDSIAGNSGNDKLYGGAGNDTLDGGSGSDSLYGGNGDDVLIARTGTDVYDGGSGFDTIDFTNIVGKISLNLGQHTGNVMFGHTVATDTIVGIEKYIGNNAGDTFYGDRLASVFLGGTGNDWFRSALGADTLTGGGGANTFDFLKKDLADGSHDTITDFTVGTDKLDLSDFLKGHTTYAEVVKVVDASSAGGPAVMVEGLVGHTWTDIAILQGIDINNVGADHRALALADLGLIG